MFLVLIKDGDFKNVMDISHITVKHSYTLDSGLEKAYKVKTFCQTGARVLYSVCVRRRSFTSSSTAKGSLLPPRSAECNP